MIRLNEPVIGEEETTNVNVALKESHVSGTVGGFIEEFERGFASYCGVKYGVSTTSGTTALHLALAALGIREGDEVIIPTFTNIATAFAVVYCNAKPVVVDSEPETYNIDVQQIEYKITPRTKAIIPVHIYGHPCDMDPLLEIAKKYNLYLIEDCAEAHGARYKGKRVGSFGDIGCFSFLANKVITTGEGGMIITNNPLIAEKARSLKNLAFSTERKFVHHEIGFNYRLTNVQAAIGVAQLRKIDKIIEKKRAISKFYNDHFRGVKGLRLPLEKEGAFSVYWVYPVLLEQDLDKSRDQVMAELEKKGIETRNFFIPMHQQPIFHKIGLFKDERCPVAEDIAQRGFYLSTGYGLTDEQLEYIADAVVQVITG